MQTIIVAPSDEHKQVAATLWRQLRASFVPFPYECSEDELSIQTGHPECIQGMVNCVASAKWLHLANRVRICLYQEFFDLPEGVPLGVLLHETLHIRLFRGRLHNNFLASLDLEDFDLWRTARTQQDVDFASLKMRCAEGLLQLVAEIGVDRLMRASPYDFRSQEYWRHRCANQYLAAPLIYPHDMTASLRPYVAAYQLVAAELALTVVTDPADVAKLVECRTSYAAALEDCCDSATKESLNRWRHKLLTFDPFADEADPEAYDDLSEQVLALTH